MGMKIGNDIGECLKGSWSSQGYLVFVNLLGRDGIIFRTREVVNPAVACGFAECDKFLGLCGLSFGPRDDMLFKSADEALDATRDFVNKQVAVTVEELHPRIRKVRMNHSLEWLDEVADYGSPDLKGLKLV